MDSKLFSEIIDRGFVMLQVAAVAFLALVYFMVRKGKKEERRK